ncbi:MAG: hypothetical protein K2P39_02875, partial [Lachnospiraceae bacterium]|nr:hypothetical protein [Lachnospiraceae bacterium]
YTTAFGIDKIKTVFCAAPAWAKCNKAPAKCAASLWYCLKIMKNTDIHVYKLLTESEYLLYSRKGTDENGKKAHK